MGLDQGKVDAFSRPPTHSHEQDMSGQSQINIDSSSLSFPLSFFFSFSHREKEFYRLAEVHKFTGEEDCRFFTTD